VRKSPHVAEFLPDLAASRGSIRCVGQGKGASVLFYRAFRIFSVRRFRRAFPLPPSWENRVTRLEIFLGGNRVFNLSSSLPRKVSTDMRSRFLSMVHSSCEIFGDFSPEEVRSTNSSTRAA